MIDDALALYVTEPSGVRRIAPEEALALTDLLARFVAVDDANHKGNVAELKIAAAAADLGIGVLAPMTEHGRYDLMFDVGGRLLRIQCKWATRKRDVVVVRIRTNYHSPTRG